VNVIAESPGTNDPVLASAVSVRTLFEIAPVHKTPPDMNASGVPDKGILAAALENVI